MTTHSSQFLFLLSPPLSGSTLIKELIEASPNVSSFQSEGQFLPGLEQVLGTPKRWEPTLPIDWPKVKQVFYANWDLSRPVRFDKSPPHLVRAEQLASHFHPCQFLVTIRNPFAQIEGLLRRGWYTSAPRAAAFWLDCARWQKHNLAKLPSTFFFTYEQLCDEPERVLQGIESFVPDLGHLDADREIHAHNLTGRPIKGIRNLNDIKIAQLSPRESADIEAVLSEDRPLVEHFGYSSEFPHA